MKIKTKRSQAELITTVLLILIAIAAVVLISTFVINMVRQNLKGTECFDTTGQFTINLEGYTYYNSSDNKTSISIERGEKEFNLTGISISLGTEASMKTFTIKPSGGSSEVSMYNGGNIILPASSETVTYVINLTGTSIKSVTRAKIAPVMLQNRICSEGIAEASIPQA